MKRFKFFVLAAVFLAVFSYGLNMREKSMPSLSLETKSSGAEIKTPEKSSQENLLKVHFIDVGQADSILIESNGSFMLVDAGNNDDAKLVTGYLKAQSVASLEYVIGTHPHEDHIGSLDTVIETFDVKKVIMPKKMHTTKTFEDVISAIEAKGLKITPPNPGDKYSLGLAEFTVIAPNGSYGDNLNNWSVGIKLIYGGTSFVMCGDAEAESESDIIKTGLDISADVLKINHHGSSTSSSAAFIDAVNPKYAVISLGKDNSYGHPHKEVLERLENKGIICLRTDESGTITAKSDGKSITWEASSGLPDSLSDCLSSAGAVSLGYSPCKSCKP